MDENNVGQPLLPEQPIDPEQNYASTDPESPSLGGHKPATEMRHRGSSAVRENEVYERFKRSWIALNWIGFSMALDFSIVLVSIQEYWFLVGGSQTWYGFMFGMYDLIQLIGSPLMGMASDRWGERKVVIFAVICNGIGNILYALAFYYKTYWLIAGGRTLAGFGASCITVGLTFITRTTPVGQVRTNSIWWYKLFQSCARVGGPVVGYISTTMPDPQLDLVGWQRIINYFTVPAWIAALNAFFIMLPLAVFKQEDANIQYTTSPIPFDTKSPFVIHVIFWCFVQICSSIIYWSLGSNVFSVAFGGFHLLSSKSQSWKEYIGGTAGFILGFITYRWVIFKDKNAVRYFLSGGFVLYAIGYLLINPYNSALDNAAEFRFFAGIAIATAGTSWFYPASNTQFSMMLTAHKTYSKGREGFLTSCIDASGALGRFMGPTIWSWIVIISDKNGEICDYSDPTNYLSEGCYLKHGFDFMIAMSVSAWFFALATWVYYNKTRTQAEKL